MVGILWEEPGDKTQELHRIGKRIAATGSYLPQAFLDRAGVRFIAVHGCKRDLLTFR